MLDESNSEAAKLHSADERVHRRLQAFGLSERVVNLDQIIATAKATAKSLGISRQDIAKSVALLSDNEPIIVVTRGDRRIDTARIQEKLHATYVRLANANEVETIFGFPIAGVSLIGAACPVKVYIDEILEGVPKLFASAGSDHAIFWASFQELIELSSATVLRY